MDYKEKYEQGLECIQEILSGAGDSIKTSILRKRLQPFFPELKESEDERIRKGIIELVKQSSEVLNKQNQKDMIAWLEKQGEEEYIDPDTLIQQRVDALADIVAEQKPTNCELRARPASLPRKVEPKFKVGDWITDGYLHCKITEILDDRYIIEYKFSERSAILFEDENYYHLWTIRDAKVGDALVHNNCTFIFMGIKNGIVYALVEHLLDGTIPVCFGEPDKDNDYHPATKEQRDLLFRNINEAGYEWDSEKKELKKMEVPSEDEKIRNEIIAFVEQSIHRGGGTPVPQEQENKWIAWLAIAEQGEQKSTDKAEPKFKVGGWL